MAKVLPRELSADLKVKAEANLGLNLDEMSPQELERLAYALRDDDLPEPGSASSDET